MELSELIEEQRKIYWIGASRTWDNCVERLTNNHKVAEYFGIEQPYYIVHGTDIQTSLSDLRRIFPEPIEITEFGGKLILSSTPCSFKFYTGENLEDD